AGIWLLQRILAKPDIVPGHPPPRQLLPAALPKLPAEIGDGRETGMPAGRRDDYGPHRQILDVGEQLLLAATEGIVGDMQSFREFTDNPVSQRLNAHVPRDDAILPCLDLRVVIEVKRAAGHHDQSVAPQIHRLSNDVLADRESLARM